jgi:membrane-associated protease RseP (regulator of RpoE activity)
MTTVPYFWLIIGILAAILAVLSIVDVVRRHLGAGPTALWILLIVILPFIGSVIYWAMRKESREEIEGYADADRELREQASRRPFDSTGTGTGPP